MKSALRVNPCMPHTGECVVCARVDTTTHRDDDLRGFVCIDCARPLIAAEVALRDTPGLCPPADDRLETA
jgi:hypothetical protein